VLILSVSESDLPESKLRERLRADVAGHYPRFFDLISVWSQTTLLVPGREPWQRTPERPWPGVVLTVVHITSFGLSGLPA
jgi:hypothetical protein